MFMRLNSRSLKAMALIIGILVVGLGMYAVFEVQEAEAKHTSHSGRLHRLSATVLTAVHYDGYTGNERWSSPTTCYVCAGFYPPAVHREVEYKYDRDYYDVWNHRWLWTSWDHCSVHTYTHAVDTTWYVVPCQQWGS